MLIPKHTVYEGILHGISGGEVIQGTGGGTSTTVVVTDYSATAYTRERAPKDALGQKGWTGASSSTSATRGSATSCSLPTTTSC